MVPTEDDADLSNNFTTLPLNIFETIFGFLDYEDVLNCKTLSPRLNEICSVYLSRSATSIEKDILNCMEVLDNQIIFGSNFKFKEKRKLLRAYNTLENLKQNIHLYFTLKRPHIGTKICWSLGQIFDNCRRILNSVRKNPFEINKLHITSMWVQSDIANMLNKIDETDFPLPGVKVVDYLDLMLDVHYNITITYSIMENLCCINGFYYLKNSKLLFYLPDIPFMKNCSERKITDDEQNALMKYLALLVNVHNRLIIKTDQTRRDLELSRRELMAKKTEKNRETSKWPQHLWKTCQSKKYNNCRHFCERQIVDRQIGKVTEVYKNCANCEHEKCKEGMKCTVNLECQLDDAPLQALRSYERLKKEILIGHSLKNFNSSIFDNKDETQDELYTFALMLEVNLPMKKPEVFELRFKHGKQITIEVNDGNSDSDTK